MLAAVLSRLLRMVVVMFGISVITFLIFFATPSSDPAARIAGKNAAQDMKPRRPSRYQTAWTRTVPAEPAR